jgi:hypothetical protein
MYQFCMFLICIELPIDMEIAGNPDKALGPRTMSRSCQCSLAPLSYQESELQFTGQPERKAAAFGKLYQARHLGPYVTEFSLLFALQHFIEESPK